MWKGALIVAIFSACTYAAASLSSRVRRSANSCPPWKPFACPDGECIPLKWLCDGNADCKSKYDENIQMCTAAARPPVSETTEFLKAVLTANGADFLEKLFGAKAKNNLKELGGAEAVAVALSESATVEEFGKAMKLTPDEIAYTRQVLQAITDNNTDIIRELGMHGSEISDIKFYVDKLADTGFML